MSRDKIAICYNIIVSPHIKAKETIMANCSGEDIEGGDSGCSPLLGLEPAV